MRRLRRGGRLAGVLREARRGGLRCRELAGSPVLGAAGEASAAVRGEARDPVSRWRADAREPSDRRRAGWQPVCDSVGVRGGVATGVRQRRQGKTNRRRREEEERKGGGVRQGRIGGDRSTPGTGGYIPGRFTPSASHQPGVKVLCSRCVLPTYLYSRLVTRTGSKGFFWRATKLQPTFTPGWASHPGVKVGCSFVSRLF